MVKPEGLFPELQAQGEEVAASDLLFCLFSVDHESWFLYIGRYVYSAAPKSSISGVLQSLAGRKGISTDTQSHLSSSSRAAFFVNERGQSIGQ